MYTTGCANYCKEVEAEGAETEPKYPLSAFILDSKLS